MSGQSHTDIPIVVTTGGDALEKHTAAMVRLDDLFEWLEKKHCAHKVLGISPCYNPPTIQLDSIIDLARVFDGSGVALHLETSGNYRYAKCFAEGWEFSACDRIEADESRTVVL